MGYPVAYRSGASQPMSGSQNSAGGYLKPPVMPSPANDNRAPAANDNVRQIAKTANQVRKWARIGLRFNPYANLFLLAWDLYDLYQAFGGLPKRMGNLNGWTKTHSCFGGFASGTRVPNQGLTCNYAGAWANADINRNGGVRTTSPSNGWNLWFQYVDNVRPHSVPGYTAANATGDSYTRFLPDSNPVYEWPEILPAMAPIYNFRPAPEVWADPLVIPKYVPQFHPMPRPGQPLPPPAHVPYWMVPSRPISNPYQPPNFQPDRGPKPQPNPWPQPPKVRPDSYPNSDPRPRNKPRPRNEPKPHVIPNIQSRPNTQDPEPTLVEVLTPGSKPQYAYQPHLRQPPPRGTKEKKLYDNKGVWAAYRALGAATELDDLVDTMYDALPSTAKRKWIKGQPVGLAEKMERVWKNLDKIDMAKAIDNYWDNKMEDEVIGKYHGAGSKGTVGLTGHSIGPAI